MKVKFKFGEQCVRILVKQSLTMPWSVYTDGSYRDGKATWAYIIVTGTGMVCHEASGFVKDQEAVDKIWNVAGEIEAASRAIKWAVDTDTKITLISDYQGIQGWANGWATNNKWSAAYADLATTNKQYISEFKFVKGHSKDKWNDYVDKLAFERLNLKE